MSLKLVNKFNAAALLSAIAAILASIGGGGQVPVQTEVSYLVQGIREARQLVVEALSKLDPAPTIPTYYADGRYDQSSYPFDVAAGHLIDYIQNFARIVSSLTAGDPPQVNTDRDLVAELGTDLVQITAGARVLLLYYNEAVAKADGKTTYDSTDPFGTFPAAIKDEGLAALERDRAVAGEPVQA